MMFIRRIQILMQAQIYTWFIVYTKNRSVGEPYRPVCFLAKSSNSFIGNGFEKKYP